MKYFCLASVCIKLYFLYTNIFIHLLWFFIMLYIFFDDLSLNPIYQPQNLFNFTDSETQFQRKRGKLCYWNKYESCVWWMDMGVFFFCSSENYYTIKIPSLFTFLLFTDVKIYDCFLLILSLFV